MSERVIARFSRSYTFTLIATDLKPGDLPAGLTRDELFAKLTGHTKGAAGLVGLFGRP